MQNNLDIYKLLKFCNIKKTDLNWKKEEWIYNNLFKIWIILNKSDENLFDIKIISKIDINDIYIFKLYININ